MHLSSVAQTILFGAQVSHLFSRMLDAIVPLDSAIQKFLRPCSPEYRKQFQAWDQQLRAIFRTHYQQLPVQKAILRHDCLLLFKITNPCNFCDVAWSNFAYAVRSLVMAYTFYGLGLQDKDDLEWEVQQLDLGVERPILDWCYSQSLFMPAYILAVTRFPMIFPPDHVNVWQVMLSIHCAHCVIFSLSHVCSLAPCMVCASITCSGLPSYCGVCTRSLEASNVSWLMIQMYKFGDRPSAMRLCALGTHHQQSSICGAELKANNVSH